MFSKYWLHIIILTIIISLISIKGFPIALGALYLPILFKVVKLQLNLSKGLVDDVNAIAFLKSNRIGIVISVVCILLVTGILCYTLDHLYSNFNGILCLLISFSPITLTLSVILYIMSAFATVQAVKNKYTK